MHSLNESTVAHKLAMSGQKNSRSWTHGDLHMVQEHAAYIQHYKSHLNRFKEFARVSPFQVVELANGSFFLPSTLRRLNITACAWNDERDIRSGIASNPPIGWYVPPPPHIRQAPCEQRFTEKLALWHSWFTDFQFGHFLCDHYPFFLRLVEFVADAKLAQGVRVVIAHRQGTVKKSPLYKFMQFLDPELAQAAVWVQLNKVACTSETLYVARSVKRLPTPVESRLSGLMRGVARRVANIHPPLPNAERNRLIYYSRRKSGGAHGHWLSNEQDAAVREAIERIAREHGREEQLIVFGDKPLPYHEQAALFLRARFAIGSHGTGLMNLIFSQPNDPASCLSKTRVLEFICGMRSVDFAPGCPYRKSTYTYLAGAPWLEFHHVLYAKGTTARRVVVDIKEVEEALHEILTLDMDASTSWASSSRHPTM